MNDYLQKVEKISNNLSIREVITDKDLILYVIRGLDSSYNFFIRSLSICGGTITFDDLHSLLFGHERMLEHQASQVNFPVVYQGHSSSMGASTSNVNAFTAKASSLSNFSSTQGLDPSKSQWSLQDFL